jgi:hypothetical protein
LLATIFWSLFLIEEAGFAFAAYYFLGPRAGSWGPEGPVGGILLYVPPILLLVPAAIVLFAGSDGAKIVGLALLIVPLLFVLLGVGTAGYEKLQKARHQSGDDLFFWPAQRNLAHAIAAQDVDQVRRLIPRAGDLNTRYKGETFLRFALEHADAPGPSYKVVQALLTAGANPNLASAGNESPLQRAIEKDPALMNLLLKGGADPNSLDADGNPRWWRAMLYETGNSVVEVDILLAHGVDIRKRGKNSGVVAWAADRHNWKAVWRLMEHGAEWKDQQINGLSIGALLAKSLEMSREYGTPISDEMRKVMEKIPTPAAPPDL